MIAVSSLIPPLVTVLTLIGAPAWSSDGHDTHRDEARGEHSDHEDGGSAFTVGDFEEFGVTLATVGPATVDIAIDLPGEIRPNGDRIAHLAARFSGIVRDVSAGIGDRVREGDVLARIESDTLTVYPITAPFGGTVIDRHLALGELVDQADPVFILADLTTVWLEVNVHQHALSDVEPGRSVTIRQVAGGQSTQAEISYVSPIIDQETRTAIARAVVPNDDGSWRPGTFVVATMEELVAVPLAVPCHALQTFEGRTTVFVAEGDRFEPRPVTVGVQGRTRVEITSGLTAGERVADEAAFLVKAELEKGEAGHAH